MKNKLLLTALVTGSVLLSGCAVYPVDDPYYDQPVRMAPPPPQYEYYGSPPVVGHVWITGYWNWVGVRHVWVPGRWEAPRPGYLWVPHRWERDGDHWRRHGGRWDRDPHPRVVPVPPPAPRPRFEYQENRHPDPAPIFRPPPERVPVPERNAPPWGERESRRPGVEGIGPFPGRSAEPRVAPRAEPPRAEPPRVEPPRVEQRDARPAPERSGGPRADRNDRRRPHPDEDPRSKRGDKDGER